MKYIWELCNEFHDPIRLLYLAFLDSHHAFKARYFQRVKSREYRVCVYFVDTNISALVLRRDTFQLDNACVVHLTKLINQNFGRRFFIGVIFFGFKITCEPVAVIHDNFTCLQRMNPLHYNKRGLLNFLAIAAAAYAQHSRSEFSGNTRICQKFDSL